MTFNYFNKLVRSERSGTTQYSNSFESANKCGFNPHNLYGTVLPGNTTGQNHFVI